MQKPFKSFKEYIEHNYYDKLVYKCKNYVFNNKSKFSTNYIPTPSYVAYSDFDLMGINFKETRQEVGRSLVKLSPCADKQSSS